MEELHSLLLSSGAPIIAVLPEELARRIRQAPDLLRRARNQRAKVFCRPTTVGQSSTSIRTPPSAPALRWTRSEIVFGPPLLMLQINQQGTRCSMKPRPWS